ncbi:LysR family transcriptional regulator [Variovorax sp. OV329]|uniref:LysR family transcriptional regulator n=1 Tax=Variovorax sp. OV329 TaxID=1882825 RepID=UPI0008DEAB61|nr:LysR family transcriptional regulator [Variovorax sp. OV329]SFM15247.1 LysR family transcriptional regulator, nitrogen assimilation regulatory protein [Variovorax sp. OV329]
MDTRILETFLLVAESGGLSSAASILGVPQSQVSRHVKELEESCGAPLLYRHGRGVSLTLAGERLREQLRPLLAQLQETLANVAAQDRKPAGPVDVALSPAFMRAAGLRLLDAMAADYPEVRVRLVSGNSRYVYEWVLHAQVDIGVLSDIGMSSQLLLEELGTARVVLVAHPDFALPDVGAAPAGLSGVPLRLPSPGQGLRRHIDIWAARHGVDLNVAYEIDDPDMTREIIATRRAAAIVSRLSIYRELADGTFVERPLGEELKARTVLATARNRPVTPAMKATIQTLKSVSAQLFAEAG